VTSSFAERESTYRTIIEPAKHKVVVPLYGYSICFGRAVGFEVVAAILESHSVLAFKLFMVPLGNFCVCEQSVVATSEAGLQTLSHVVVEREVGAEGVVRVLPVAVLWFVDCLR
jgi:hypothetical protein